MPAMIKNDGISIPQMVIPSAELLIDLKIMSPKHLLAGGRILVESHVNKARMSATATQVGVVNLGLGAKRVFFNARTVISSPNTRWK